MDPDDRGRAGPGAGADTDLATVKFDEVTNNPEPESEAAGANHNNLRPLITLRADSASIEAPAIAGLISGHPITLSSFVHETS